MVSRMDPEDFEIQSIELTNPTSGFGFSTSKTWVDWFNTRRLLGPLGDIPPAEFKAQCYAQAAVP